MDTKKRIDTYEIVTEKLLSLMEKGEIPWHKPWKSDGTSPYNRVTRRVYSFLNQMLLNHTGEYASFKQWTELGGHIKRGAKGEKVVFWTLLGLNGKQESASESINSEKQASKLIPYLRYFTVFHISNVEGVEPLELTETFQHKPLEEATDFIEEYCNREDIELNIENSAKAFYNPSNDTIVVPELEQFEYLGSYYGTVFHEIIHSTGARKRLNRLNTSRGGQFGSESYSKEELIAEIGSAYLMSDYDLNTEYELENSAAYLQSWMKVLRNDKRLIVTASTAAVKAVNYTRGIDTLPIDTVNSIGEREYVSVRV